MSPNLQGTQLSVCSTLCWQGVFLRNYLSKSRSSSLRNHYYRKRSNSRDETGKSRWHLLKTLRRQYHANLWRSFCRQPVRPSFKNSTSVQAASNYGYVGCFSYLNPGPTYAFIRTESTPSCLAYCGSLNYPFASRSGPDSNTEATTCGCGTETQSGLQVADNRCATACDRVSTVA